MNRVLDGIRIIDFTRVYAGTTCTAILADMGAEVIKIERPKTGAEDRTYMPIYKGISGYHMHINRGKKGITLNLKNKKGIEIVKKLVEKSDILVENFTPGVMKKLGIAYEDVKEINPKIIYTSISGYGQYGPYSDRKCYDLAAQAMSGLTTEIRAVDTQNSPLTLGGLSDTVAGWQAALGTMFALYYREITGKGQKVDVSMMDSAFSLLAYRAEQYLLTGELAKPSGCAHALSAPFDAFKTKDGYVIITTANEMLFENVCQAMHKPELHQDPRFETDAKRARNNIELKKIIEEWLSSYTAKEAEEILLKYSIPCGHIQTIPEVCNGPQVIARDMIVEVEHPVVGKIKIPGNPIKLFETPAQLKIPAPLLGQHNEEILVKLLGYELDYVKQLQNEGII